MSPLCLNFAGKLFAYNVCMLMRQSRLIYRRTKKYRCKMLPFWTKVHYWVQLTPLIDPQLSKLFFSDSHCVCDNWLERNSSVSIILVLISCSSICNIIPWDEARTKLLGMLVKNPVCYCFQITLLLKDLLWLTNLFTVQHLDKFTNLATPCFQSGII